MSKTTLGILIGNRNFFPDVLVTEARKTIIKLLEELGIDYVIPDESETKLGAVESWNDSKVCAGLFKKNKDKIDGILVLLPNFGFEKGIADTVKLSGLDVPILVQASPDDLNEFGVSRRRDAFCGKISVCNNLRQYGFSYSLTESHTSKLDSNEFKNDLNKFIGICRVVKGISNARLGAIGARPNDFNTVRYSEKILQRSGISVSTIDFSEIFSWAKKIQNDDTRVKNKIDEIHNYANTSIVPSESMILMAKLGIVISDWMKENDLNATALQCWTSIQENYGVNACTIMSMMSEQLLPSACEVDISGVLSMYALQLASNSPSALVDWNNNYGEDKNKCVFFHCGNWAKSFLPDIKVQTAEILGTTLGEENTYGAVNGRTPAGPLTYARITTDDFSGKIKAYVGEGEFTNDELETFGSRAVVKVEKMQDLLKYICLNGFEHHCAMSGSNVADIIEESFKTYLKWEVYKHN